jgi:hypothetical protein
MRITIPAVTVCVLMTACAASPRQRPLTAGPVEIGPNTLDATRHQLAGTWTLARLEVLDPSGQLVPVRATAQLTYDEFGNLKIAGVIEEPLPGQKGLVDTPKLDYTGRATIDTLRHELVLTGDTNIAPDPALLKAIGLESRRKYELDGQQLTMSTMDKDGKVILRTTYRK